MPVRKALQELERLEQLRAGAGGDSNLLLCARWVLDPWVAAKELQLSCHNGYIYSKE